MDKPILKERLEHILAAIRNIITFVENETELTFAQNIQLQSAVQFQFLIIGEAIRHIDTAILEKYNYPWHIPRSFRNFIIHEYHGVKMERIYYATQDLATLENIIAEMLSHEL